MLVSWNWLNRYVDLSMQHEELASRLALSGLNHEGTEMVDGDPVIDLEVTSNRGDCLGHIGVAREVAVLYDRPLQIPAIELAESELAIESLLTVRNEFLDACPRYTARVIRGVKVGPSPAWLVTALRSVGIESVNNVVDVTNFVMLECGQPLHAFDHAAIADHTIAIRPAVAGEKLTAIDHRDYVLDDSMCVIADSKKPLAIAGVMGGAGSEITEATVDVVLEAAVFTPLSVRRTARRLKLHSPSSFRFERRVDPIGVDWASRRAAELICEVAGGSGTVVAGGAIDTAPKVPERVAVPIRADRIRRVLGITIDPPEVARILTALGCRPSPAAAKSAAAATRPAESFVPPSWRHDLTREVDLIEEVARIHGYDKIPEDSPVPVAPSRKRTFDVAMEITRHTLTAGGLSEAMTPSIVTSKLDESLSPWTGRPALQTQAAMLEGARRLRRSLIPSLVGGRAANWASSGTPADLFEIAHAYLPGDSPEALPAEQYCVAMIRGGDFFELKGIVENLLAALGIRSPLGVHSIDVAGFTPGGMCRLEVGGDQTIGFLGMIDDATLKPWKLAGPVGAAELSIPTLMKHATLVPQQRVVSPFPAVQRDLNFVVPESVRWNQLRDVVRSAVGAELAAVRYQETYRDPAKDGEDMKRILLSLQLQSHTETLSGDQADRLVGRAIDLCERELAATVPT